MDLIENLAKQASQITMYDVKSYYNQARNMVLSVSEMEAKVREATNDDPWGASSTLMKEISEGTQNYATFNEIMPTIYSRFMEKEAREWRQIYKALTLLEFLVKNGSERVVDDARAHISTIKMLRSFHYIDDKGKDQGINVRNRASEIAALLGDVEKIRQERRKAKANRTKYGGQGNDGGMSFVTTGGSRYGGFGSEAVGGTSGEGGGGGAGYDGADDYRPSRSFADKRDDNPEYDEYEGADDFDEQPRRTASTSAATTSRPASRPQPPPKNAPVPAAKAKPAPPPAKEVNLFDFDDNEPISAAAPAVVSGGDDDFDDFQSAPTGSSAPVASTPAPKPATNANAGLFDLLNSSSTTTSSQQAQQRAPVLSNPVQNFSQPPLQAQNRTPTYAPSYGQPLSPNNTKPSQPAMTARPSYTSGNSTTGPVAPKAAASSGFDDLWNSSISSVGGAKSGGAMGTGGGLMSGKKTMADLEREKAQSGLWGGGSGTGSGGQQKSSGSGAFDDLLF